MADETTSRIGLDISDLKRGIQEANRLIRVANSEFKATSASMDNWAKSADGISAKLKQLDSVLKSQNSILDDLEAQYRLVADEQGETSKGAQELLIKINNQKAAIAKTEKEIEKWNNNLNDLDNELDDAENSVSDFADSTRDINDAADDASDGIKSLGDGFTVVKGAIANLIADGIQNLISGFANLATETREYRNEMAKVDTAFAQSGYSAETASKTYKDFYAILGDEGQAVEAVNHLAKLTDSEKDLATWTDIATGVYATFGDSLPIEGLTEAANETAKVGQVTGPLADALNWTTLSTEQWNKVLQDNPDAMAAFNKGIGEGMNAEDAFNEALAQCSDEQERQQLIMNTLNKMYKKAGKQYAETNADVMAANEAQSNLADAYAKLGEKAEPIITTIKQGMADLLTAAIGLVDGVDFSEVSTKIQEGFGDFIENVLPKIKDGLKWIVDNQTALTTTIAAVGAGFAAWNVVTTIQKVTAAIKAMWLATEGATVAQKLLNIAQKANVVGIIITAIMALVAAFVVLWNKSDAFREFWINLWEKIKDIAGVAWQAIKKFFISAWEKIQEVWNEVQPYFLALWEGIKKTFSVVKKILGAYFKAAWEAIKLYWSVATGYFQNIWNTIKGIFAVVKAVLSGNWKDAWEAIKNIVKGWASYFSDIWGKIKKVFEPVASWLGEKFGSAWQAIKNKFAGWGEFWSGLWTKVKNKFGDIGSSIGSAMSNAVKNGINAVLYTVERTINKGISLINSAIKLANKLPGIDVGTLSAISLPRLEKGGVLKKGQIGLLEGNGAEAVVPLEKNKLWIRNTAKDMSSELKKQGIIGSQGQPQQINQTFNQYNTSPKALSRLEIYRQTKNQLDFAKGV